MYMYMYNHFTHTVHVHVYQHAYCSTCTYYYYIILLLYYYYYYYYCYCYYLPAGILEESGSQDSGPLRESESDSSSNPRTPASGEGTSSTGSNRQSLLGSVEDMAFVRLGTLL